MLRDELDEARTSSTTQLPEDDPIEEDEGEKGEAPDLQFAYDMLQVSEHPPPSPSISRSSVVVLSPSNGLVNLVLDQVEVKELRSDATKVKDLRHRLAQLESQESVHSKRMSALDSELERKTSDNASLTTQVRARSDAANLACLRPHCGCVPLQVEALGFALDKMKAYLDASGGAVSMV